MTPTQLKEAAHVMLAASEGKQVQYMPQSQQEWRDILDPSWDWYSNRYRIKPECLPIPSGKGFIKVREVIE